MKLSKKAFGACKHPDIWFDRSIEICGPNCSFADYKEHSLGGMHDRCTECGMSDCEMRKEKK